MNASEYVVEGSIAMTRGSILRVEGGRDLTLYVWEGAVWLTQEGDPRDRYVGPGEWFRLDRQGVAVAHATQRTVMSITAPIPERFAKRIVLAKAGSALPIELYAAAARASLRARLLRFWAGLFASPARPTTAAL